MALSKVSTFLVVTSNGDCRLMKRAAKLAYNEMAFPITIELPQIWGIVHHELATHISVIDEAKPTITIGHGISATPEEVAEQIAKELTQ